MLFNCPLSPQKADQLIQALNLSAVDRVLDVGCGTGEFLIRLVEQTGASGLGIDIAPDLITQAQEKVAERLPNSSIEFRTENAAEGLPGPPFDTAICMGSTYAFGRGQDAYPNALAALQKAVRPRGQILIGETYWKQHPDHDYVEFIGDPVGIYNSHAENIEQAEKMGLVPLYALTANLDEWDHFEWERILKLEQEAVGRRQEPA
ncbi:MAG: class I SAM-dependent methyltransferase, partial [Chloroflexota bacterium]